MPRYIDRDEFVKRLNENVELTNPEEQEWVKDECIRQAHAMPSVNVGEWISVDERLPRYNDTVLVYRPTMGAKILADTYKGYYNEDTGDWEEGWVNFGQNSIGMNVITHWMPLPEPPKGV